MVRDIDRLLAPGQWIPVKLQLASIQPLNRPEIRGLVAESDLRRLEGQLRGTFIPDDPARGKVAVKVIRVADTASDKLPMLELASDFGGPIAVRRAPEGGLKPEDGRYLVQMRLAGARENPYSEAQIAQTMRGVVHLDGVAESLLSRAFAQVLKVLIREAGL